MAFPNIMVCSLATFLSSLDNAERPARIPSPHIIGVICLGYIALWLVFYSPGVGRGLKTSA